MDLAGNRGASPALAFEECDFGAPMVEDVAGPDGESSVPFLEGRAVVRLRIAFDEPGITVEVRDDSGRLRGQGALRKKAGAWHELDLAAAPDGATISVGPGLHAPFAVVGRSLTVRSIAGAAATFIDPAGVGRAVLVEGQAGQTFRLEGFTIRNGSAVDGAGVLVRSGAVMVEECVFLANVAAGYGGAVFVEAGSCVLRDITATGNAAARGGAVASLDEVAIESSTLEANASSIEGGGLWAGPDAVVTLSGSRLCRNTPSNVSGSIADLGGNVFSQDCDSDGLCDLDEIGGGARVAEPLGKGFAMVRDTEIRPLF